MLLFAARPPVLGPNRDVDPRAIWSGQVGCHVGQAQLLLPAIFDGASESVLGDAVRVVGEWVLYGHIFTIQCIVLSTY